MISFVYSLDHGTTSQQEAMIQSGLEARFPGVRFIFDAEVLGGYENTILPIAGEAQSDAPDRIVLTPIPKGLANEVRETFRELLREVALVRPS
jgi:hypothetical protein